MKPIVIATDYAPAANHAADYAAQLARSIHAPLTIFHSWMIPAMGGEAFAVPYPMGELEETEQKLIEDEAKRLQKTWGVEAKPFQAMGFAVDEIERYCAMCDAGLVVMGMRHIGPILQTFGSVATAFIKRDKFPVLIVPEKVNYRSPQKIMLTTDFNTKAGWHELDVLKELAALFGASIHIMNAVPEELHQVAVSKNAPGPLLEKMLKDYPHSWHYESDGDVLHSIYKVSDEIHADWIAAVPHRMNWFQRLINVSTSKQLSLNTNIPLLILPEHATVI